MVVDIQRDGNRTYFDKAKLADGDERLIAEVEQEVRQLVMRGEQLASQMILRLGEELRELERDREMLPDRKPQ